MACQRCSSRVMSLITRNSKFRRRLPQRCGAARTPLLCIATRRLGGRGSTWVFWRQSRLKQPATRREIELKRRDFLKRSATLAGAVVAANQFKSPATAQAVEAARSGGAVVVDPKALFDISPHLYMQ